ncbi:dTDP-4-dehydrorhamnose reductase [Lentibacillus sp. JNUCC-1]|uniref:sugar nucleotide-binding protein n=1 Tax=Lentibacillus sp. JNUCC-1 TaxID=2654513 RepID=UPI0012E76E4B|nr:sugar nucleotide-binding protein [Lentibacillus sp. JNUCC-1]MUV37451.1 dTDP-4-dehydrorhamnose reductase [Lentibacillus sp. JNUCC-1]
MKICIFGADGYVGASVYKRAKNIPGAEVTGVDLLRQSPFSEVSQLDVNDPEAFSELYKQEDPDVVVWSVMSGFDEDRLIEQGLIHVINHLKPETKLVYMSTDFVFGEGDGPYTEEAPLSKLPEDHLFSTYNNAKVKAERLINNELNNFVILRAGPIYGENDVGKWDDRTEELLYQLRSGREIEQREDLVRTFVHVRDLADTIIDMVQNNDKGIYHVGPKTDKSYYEFMQTVAKENGFSPSLIKKDTKPEEPDYEIPKNTALDTQKINQAVKVGYR